MHNLRNTKHAKFSFKNANLTAIAWDVTDNSLILASGPAEDNPAITLRRLPSQAQDANDTIAIASWDAPSPIPDLAVDRILNLHDFPDTKTISLILAGGDIVIVREDPQPGEDLIEIVGSVDAGINAAAWSPDEELLAISTGANTLLLMTRAFESAANISYSPEDVEVSNHVSVGWGKKETQFKGRGAAKALRDPTVPEHVDEGTLSPLDDGSVSITWRGDGQYLAVNSVLDVEPKRRVIRVYSRDGVLESVSEPVNGLESALSWKPSGQLIAGIQRQQDEVMVVFFERNGLLHGEFSLRLSKEELATHPSRIQLQWNSDSTVLAVTIRNRIQLWTMSNYHYYLKQEIILSDSTSSSPSLSWHPEKPLHLSCVNAFDIRNLSYRSEISRGSVTPPNDIGLVAVIDGRRIKITPLGVANFPPPMALDEIELSAPALDVAINESGDELAVLHHGSISLLTCNYSSKPAKMASLKISIQISPDTLIAADITKQDGWVNIPETQHLYFRTDHDRIFYHEVETSNIHVGPGFKDPAFVSNEPTAVVVSRGSGQEINFRLSENGVLHIQSPDQALRITGCTSFLATISHLIYTTSQHIVKFVHLSQDELDIPGDEVEKDERCRSMERGAKIVTVMPSAYSLVLQMPRGNLETIYPRALVLAGVRQSVQDRDYKKAFMTCRAHRVDMNILHDYMPQQLMGDVELFVKQLKKTEYIDLFLSSLSEDDVSQTMYRDTLSPAEVPIANGQTNGVCSDAQLKTDSKVNQICDAFLKVLRTSSTSRLQNIVTAHVCKNPPDLEAGLKLVSELRSKGDETKLEEAVEHICFLADVNRLYDTALGIYDLEVALLVAQQAQKDPREYLPYLEALHEMELLRMRFTIDDDLKRYPKALGHLHSMDAFEELKSYAQKHELYNATIDLYRYDTARLNELMRLYADFLSSRNRFKEAGIAYEYISDHTAAYPAYRAASMWRESLANALLVPLSATELSTLAHDLADSCEESKDYKSAATINLEHSNDLESAAKLLCKGYLFADAMRQVTLRQRPELLSSIIDPGLVDASASMTEMLSEMKSQIGAQVPRLRELRQRKIDDPMAFLDGADGGDADIPDNISLAATDASTTGGTFMTRYTNRTNGTLATNATRKTSKNRRREERKRARGKKGTIYEEEYLENSISRLIERLNDVGGDISALIQGLMRRGMRERALAVQTVVEEVFKLSRDCMDEVFGTKPSESGVGGVDDPTGEARRPWGGEGVLWDALRLKKREAPVLREPEVLALLAG